ncbi:hypothetical protein B0H17DRAFT_1206445 [Mycena rosella]|uniref:Uncharacterized protein n=1 Tax=Mycena rosella TaxID=1033263 RepID=A0AAD7GCW2_MYCRO|nr:hypothetical protein B0H17DRAFT_1206445 [Mycena rosella]
MGVAIKNVRAYTKPNAGTRALGSVRNTKTVSLAVVRSTAISAGGARCPDINLNSIRSEKANIKLTGQILTLKAVAALPEDGLEVSGSTAEGNSDAESPAWTWLWMGGYLMGKSTMKGTNITTDKPHTITVAGHLVEPISPNTIDVTARLPAEELPSYQFDWGRLGA